MTTEKLDKILELNHANDKDKQAVVDKKWIDRRYKDRRNIALFSICAAFVLLFILLFLYKSKLDKDEKLSQVLKENKLESYINFAKSYDDKQVFDSIYSICNRMGDDDIDSLYHIGQNIPATEDSIKSIIISIANKSKDSKHIWELIKYYYPTEYDKKNEFDRENKYSRREEAFKNEEDAWKYTTEEDTEDAYKYFLENYPKGKYSNKAEKKSIDKCVEKSINRTHQNLPEFENIGKTNGNNSIVKIKNHSDYTAYFYFSSTAGSKKITVESNKSASITIPNGTYKIMCEAGGTFIGAQSLKNGIYLTDFTISESFSSGY